MPTLPDPDSPFITSRLQADIGRIPGAPSMAGKPSVQPADLTFPTPPAPSAAPVGRPPTPPTPTPVSAQPPQQPPSPITTQAPSQLPLPPVGGVGATTPLGTVIPSATGTPELALSPEGGRRYQETVLKLREQLGPVPKLFRHPDLPPIPTEPGRSNFNPFTGMWTRGSDGS